LAGRGPVTQTRSPPAGPLTSGAQARIETPNPAAEKSSEKADLKKSIGAQINGPANRTDGPFQIFGEPGVYIF